MGFPLDITLNPSTQGGSNTNKVYNQVGNTLTSSVRRVPDTSTTTPETMTISHRRVKKGLIKEDQHMVRLDKELTDPDKGEVKLSCWFVVNTPLSVSGVTNQDVLDMLGRLIVFLRGTDAVTKLLNSEV